MQANIEYELSTRLNLSNRAYKYILPFKPEDKYRISNPKKVAAYRQTEKCPYPMIRQLYLLYQIPKEYILDLKLSHNLMQKFQTNRELGTQDENTNTLLEVAKDQQTRLLHLKRCISKYIDHREKISKRNAMLESLMQMGSKKENEQLINIHRTMESDLSDLDRKYAKIYRDQPENKQQHELNHKSEIDKMYEGYHSKLHMKRQQHLTYQNNHFEFMHYAIELERVLLIILKSKYLLTKGQQRESVLLTEMNQYDDNLKYILQRISQFYSNSIDKLYTFRERITNQSLSESEQKAIILQHNEIKTQWDHIQKKLRESAYESIYEVSQIINNDMKAEQQNFNGISQPFNQYLKSFIIMKEVSYFRNKEKDVDQIIRSQKMALTNHLKRNHGMVVPYIASENYLHFISSFKERRYLQPLLQSKIADLEYAIKYTTQDYKRLYTMACDNDPSVRDRVAEYLQSFIKGGEKKDQEYCIHLQESCRNLMRLVQ